MLFPRRSVAGSTSGAIDVAKGRARRARKQASLASWADGSDGGKEGEPPPSALSTPTASTSANQKTGAAACSAGGVVPLLGGVSGAASTVFNLH